MTTISISVNGLERTVNQGTTLAALVEQLQTEARQETDPTTVATAVNEIFVSRSAREAYTLQANDAVFTFSPITGG
ncbi:sulfur carrier protein ThiS [Advenella alkanexedens]|uniref:sulfur carrier protein ThiS n=1 Tax=Advenella alkanexedens TaxID=1481665 RepID=UPI0016921ADA|nr:sulfur carrier protein ThiS [Advenella alkanexedens]NLY34605.1 sulfur carrier protein ThiS [Alcaligenaceae bacterium]WKU20377.1 sulfur carrier protein ThiS [Advenella alkanexedens]